MDWYLITAAVILDLLLGDPGSLPHPVRWIGTLTEKSEAFWVKAYGRTRLSGLFGTLSVIFITLIPVFLILQISGRIHPDLKSIISVLLIYYSFALRDLNAHGWSVYKALKAENLTLAKEKLSWIVSRQTAEMDEQEITRSTLESLSENFLDSVVAPLFFAAIFGPMGAVAYRVVNTLDAMWGYKNEQYLKFGFFAAKTDDWLNWIPARISALLFAISAFILPGYSLISSLKTVFTDANKHSSPNSGYPEAAAAGALQVGFGGEAIYFDQKIKKPEIGAGEVKTKDIKKMIFLNFFSGLILIGWIYFIGGTLI